MPFLINFAAVKWAVIGEKPGQGTHPLNFVVLGVAKKVKSIPFKPFFLLFYIPDLKNSIIKTVTKEYFHVLLLLIIIIIIIIFFLVFQLSVTQSSSKPTVRRHFFKIQGSINAYLQSQ